MSSEVFLKVTSSLLLVIMTFVRFYFGCKQVKEQKLGKSGYLGNILYVFIVMMLLYFAVCFNF